ncbi:hypothetical protein E4U13_000791 [Claviceps humidiphila]|uniref:Uncharacterized protein n=1 Tax=Claviceps humidiphila TaxID=1294629 RepID=A0A9P7Q373_9HYPO|nr:hypothetical protein E4U13_000791 [Claviceps humidiphila]
MQFLSLIYIFGAIVSPVIANTVPNAEEVANTPGPSPLGEGHEVNEAGNPTAEFLFRRKQCSLPLPPPHLPLLQHRLPLQMLSGPDSRSTGKDGGVQNLHKNSLGDA